MHRDGPGRGPCQEEGRGDMDLAEGTAARQAITYAGQIRERAELAEARGWLADCGIWSGERPSDREARRLVSRHYRGGWRAFLRDVSDLVQ